MNRCLSPLPTSRSTGRPWAVLLSLALLVVVAPWSAPASAQDMPVRQFPPAAKRGMLTVTAPPQVQINGTPERLAPGARIRNANNMLVMSGALVGQSVVVNYVRERNSGMLQEVWILNPAEQEVQRSGMETITNFIFGSDADKPKTDDGKTPFDQLPKYPRQ